MVKIEKTISVTVLMTNAEDEAKAHVEADAQSVVLAEVHKFIDACVERVAQGVEVK